MPDPLVVQLANEFRRQLQARDAVQMAEMARRWLQVERRLRGEINGLAQEVYARWWEGGAHGDRRTLLELERYRALLAQVQREMQAYQRYAEDANSVLCAPTPDGIVDAVRRTAGLSAERRHALITAGLETARRYRWDCIAASLRDVYRQAVGEAT